MLQLPLYRWYPRGLHPRAAVCSLVPALTAVSGHWHHSPGGGVVCMLQEWKDPSWNRHVVLQDQQKEWGFVEDAAMTSRVGAFLWG